MFSAFDPSAVQPAEFAAGIKDPGRARRVRLVAEFFQEVLAERVPSLEARLFVAGGAMAWLEHGGSLDRDFWRVRAPFGSHHQPAYLWRLMRDSQSSSRGETESGEVGNIDADDSERTP